MEKERHIHAVQIHKNRMYNFFIFSSDLARRETPIEKVEDLERYKNEIPSLYYSILEKDKKRKKPEIGVYRVYMNIHNDDMIYMIKKKIMYAHNLLNDIGLSSRDKVSMNELYLYGLKRMKGEYTMKDVYRILTQNDNIPLSYTRLLQFLLNIYNRKTYSTILNERHIRETLEGVDENHIFSYEEFSRIELDFKDLNTYFNIGQRYHAETEYPITVNPFNVVEYDRFLVSHSKDILSTQNTTVLLDLPKLSDDVIFFTTAMDVFDFNEENSISQQDTSKIYFPFLYDDNIRNKEELKQAKDRLLTNAVIEDTFLKQQQKVDLFHEIYHKRESELSYTKGGIETLDIILHPKNKMKTSLLNFFKILRTSKETPFLKYNPSTRKENMYRLFTEGKSKNGKKIPYLPKSAINKIKDKVARVKSVASYTHYTRENKEYECYTHIYEDLSIQFLISTKHPSTLDEMTQVIHDITSSFLEPLYNYLQEQGFVIEKFAGFNRYVDILNISYSAVLPIEYKLSLSKFKHCISSVFNVIEPDVKKGIHMRYKRVSHYNKMDGIEAFIVELTHMNTPDIVIVNRIQENFSLSYEDARKEYLEWLSSVQVQQQQNQNRKLKIKSHPGFPCRFSLEPYTKNLLIKVENLNNITYLNVIPKYIEAILHITQTPDHPYIREKIMKRVCKGEFEEEEVEKDIQSGVGEALEKQEDFRVEEEGLMYDSELDDDDGILGLLSDGEEDYGEDLLEAREMKGGGSEEGLLFGEDDELILEEDTEEEKDEEKEEPIQEEQERKRVDEMERNVVGMNLTGTNYFLRRLQERDEKLFLKKTDGRYNSYSRICPFNVRRQPVILTQEEKDNIDKNYPGSYDKAIHYGSDENHKHWYICPRFWCLKTNTSMTEEDVKKGKCGGSTKIIPQDAKVVPDDAFVFEFKNDNQHKDKDGKYIQHYPGFVKEGNHPDGLCIPCCFKSWDSKSQQKRREECMGEKKVTEKDEEIRRQDADYIKNPEKMPLSKDRWGMLPLSVQKLLHTDNMKCMKSTRNKVKPFTYCMLRKGIENSGSQSFLALIADVYVDYKIQKMKEEKRPKMEIENVRTPSIREMRNVLSRAITLDKFVQYFRGSLVDSFSSEYEDIDINPYLSSQLAKQLDIPNRLLTKTKGGDSDMEDYMIHFKNVCNAYENYIRYLRSEEEQVDHTYLWDVITTPNELLFPNGINLVLLRIPEDDMTNNVELVCPTNQYSNELFDSNKHSLLAILKDGYYEPIYLYRDEEIRINVNKLFHKKNSQLPSNIRYILDVVNQGFQKCIPQPSLPKVYEFKDNLDFATVKELFKEKKIKILRQISNYSNRIVGVYVELLDTKERGYIPIKPSPMNPRYRIDYFDDDKIFKKLDGTVDFLRKVYKLTDKKLAIKPRMKILDDGLVVGILTSGNQFVPLKKPEQNIHHMDLEEQKGIDYMVSDKISSLQNNKDEERTNTIHKINLETSFYQSFRNTLRILLRQSSFVETKEQIERILKKDAKFYNEKIRAIKRELKNIMDPYIVFKEFQEKELLSVGNVSMCSHLTVEKCQSSEYCSIKKDGTGVCKLAIPSSNLISNYDNRSLYYTRLADEIIRYKDIYNYLFHETVYLSNLHLDYDLHSHEIILLETILSSYFDDIDPEHINTYVHHKTREFVQPVKSQLYNHKFSLEELLSYTPTADPVKQVDELPEDEEVEESDPSCVVDHERRSKGMWKVLLKDAKERVYSNIEICTFDILRDIYQDYTGRRISIKRIKSILLEEYRKVFEKHGKEKIIQKILIDEGKHRLMSQVAENRISFQDTLISENYYITNFDIHLFCMRFQLPVLVVSSTELNELRGWNLQDEGKRVSAIGAKSKYKHVWIVNNERIQDYYYIIRQSGIKRNTPLEYVLFHRDNSIKLYIDSFTSLFRNQLERIYIHRPSFDDYINKYMRLINIRRKLRNIPIQEDKLKKIKRKKPIRLVVK